MSSTASNVLPFRPRRAALPVANLQKLAELGVLAKPQIPAALLRDLELLVEAGHTDAIDTIAAIASVQAAIVWDGGEVA